MPIKFVDEPKKEGGIRFVDEPSKAEPPIGSELAAQIPTGGYPKVEPTVMAGEPKFAEKAAMYASAVPAGGLAAGALRTATAGTRAAPYTARLAEALIPQTGKGLAKATGTAAAISVPAEAARYQAERMGAGPVGQELTEFGAGLGVGGIGALGKYGYGRAADLARALRGVKPEPLRATTAQQLGQLTAEQQAAQAKTAQQFAKTTAEKEQELARTRAVQEQLARQPAVAEQRAKATATTPEAAGEIQRGVREKLGARVSEARTAEQQAAQTAATAQRELQQTEAAMNALEQRMAAQPGITAEQFGRDLQQTTAKLAKDASTARKQAAGYEEVFGKAGDEPTVDTSGSIESIKKLLKQTRNPTLQNILSEIKSQLTTGAKLDPNTGEFLGGAEKLSLRSVDSLKGYLDSVIQGRVDKYGKLDKEIANTVQNLKNQLMMKAKSAYPDYGQAMNRFREMSRPLDIVERHGSLKKVLDQDPVSTAYKMTEAEVTGHIIRKANAGNPTFSRLLQVRPDLQESARLYFTKDLFGKEAAPTAKSFENWLASNERSLRQTGLYDEFSTLKKAQSAAQEAVDVAKGTVTAAEAGLKEAAAETKKAESLAKKSTARLAEVLKTAETPEQIARRVASAERAAAPAVSKFETQAKQQEGALQKLSTEYATQTQKQQDLINMLGRLEDDVLRAKKPADIKATIERTANRLSTEGLITNQQRDEILRQTQSLGESIEARNEALKRVRNIVIGSAALAGVGWGGRHIAYGLE